MKIAIAILVLLCASRVCAATDSPETRLREADRYLATTPPKELFADMAEQVAKTLPPDNRQAFKDSLTKNLDVDAVTKAMKDAMVKNFSTEELSALADFYGSPVGKAAMKKFGGYMADLMPILQGEMMKAIAKTNQELPDAKP